MKKGIFISKIRCVKIIKIEENAPKLEIIIFHIANVDQLIA